MPNFVSPDGDLRDIYISDYEILDRYVGNQLWVWGYNATGQIGDNTTLNRSSPVQTVAGGTNWVTVAQGQNSVGAIKTDGTLWTWGANDFGQLGSNSIVGRSSPGQVAGTNWRNLEVGIYSALAIKTDGTLWSWGNNGFGTVGDNTVANKSSPVQIAGTNWKQISRRGYTSGAIKTDGTLWMWGYNFYGNLGDISVIHRSSPVQIAGTNWNRIITGTLFTAAFKTDGTLWMWGANTYGQLGDNTILHRSSPVQLAGTNWKQISCYSDTSAAIKTDGTLWVWGRNNLGTLGTNDGVIVGVSSPVQTVAGGTNWKQVVMGDGFVLAIKTDSTLWGWGRNSDYGQLGDNTISNKSSPMQLAGGTIWKSVAATLYNGSAITLTES